MSISLGNPVRGTIHPLGWARPAGNTDWAETRPFGDLSIPQYGPHNGIDLGNTQSGSPVLSSAAGQVVFASNDPASGNANIVIVDHGNGYRSWYAHLGSFTVRVGERVTQGEQVGTHDTTGWATAAHLHFQVDQIISGVRRNVDPWPLLAQNQAAPVRFAVISTAGVNVRTQSRVDPTNVYRTSGAPPNGYLIGVKMRFNGFVAGGTFRFGPNGSLAGTSWARVYLNGGYRFVAKPFIKLVS